MLTQPIPAPSVDHDGRGYPRPLLLFADRTPKVSIERIKSTASGPTAARSDGIEQTEGHANPAEAP